MTPADAALLAAAGLAGGAINAAAGGGSLVTFPALLAVGLNPLVANVTNTVALTPGYLGGVLGHGRRREPLPEVGMRALLGAAVLGALAGVALLLLAGEDVFSGLAPWLVLAALGLLLAQGPVLRALRARDLHASPRLLLGAVLVGGVYGAYFGGALGVMLLAVLGVTSRAEYGLANAVKTSLSFVINVLAAGLFAVLAPVAWGAAGVVAVASLVGGYAGGRVAQRVPVPVLRGFTAVLGLAAVVSLVT